MNINEKIDLLMRLTKTTNSAMARFTAMDASHLSRLRRGERSVAPGAAYLSRMAVYFARHCKEDYQRRTLNDLVKLPPDSLDTVEQLTNALEGWLNQEDQPGGQAVEQFLGGIAGRTSAMPRQEAERSDLLREEQCWCTTEADSCRLLYGNQGKRQAVICFLERVLQSPPPIEVFLFSDEDMEWMTEDRSFIMEWAQLMMKLGAAGHQITIIHTISRHLDEMLAAITQWMPLYMTGAIHPYYFPKKRDGLLKRTIFAAPGLAAVTSSSIIQSHPEQMVLYLTEEKAIQSALAEFNRYFSLCRPLMKIFTTKDYHAHLDMMTEFEKEEANALIKTPSFSALTMPEDVLRSVFSRMDIRDKKAVEEKLIARQQQFLANLNKKYSTEIFRLAKPTDILEGRAPVPFSNLFGLGEVFYTREEFRHHLQYIIELMEKNSQYQVCLSEDTDDSPFLIYAKEDLGAMVIRSGEPFAAFALNESNMAAAFWDYLRNKKASCRLTREEVLEKLKELEKELTENTANAGDSE